MLNAIITHKGNTLLLEFPCKRMLLAEHLASIGIRTQPSEIKCIDEEDAPIQVKIYGESEFDRKLASLVSPENSIQGVNGWCDIYHNLPYANKQQIQSAVLNGEVNSLKDFGMLLMNQHTNNVTEHFYCPLVASVYFRDEYGNCDDFPNEYEGDFLSPYEDRIRELIQREDGLDSENLAAYFYGSNGAVGKLKEIHFGTQNVDGVLYGSIRIELTEPLTPEETEEIREYLIGQCADGYASKRIMLKRSQKYRKTTPLAPIDST
jgi:hypothetical protein